VCVCVCVCVCERERERESFKYYSLASINWIFNILYIHVAGKSCTIFMIAFVYKFYVNVCSSFSSSLKKTL